MNATVKYKIRLRTHVLSSADRALLSLLVTFVSLTSQAQTAANLFGFPAGSWQQYFLTPDVQTQAAFWEYVEPPPGNRIYIVLPNSYLTENQPPSSAAGEVYDDSRIQYNGYYVFSSNTNTDAGW
jgi:hypothetical protein